MNNALADAVHRVKVSLAVDVCSVYLADPSSSGCILRATDGLEPRAVGSVRFRRYEGLVGTVFASGRPLRLESAEHDPRYRNIPEFNEQIYRAFLGVPISVDGQAVGVLSVRQINARVFSGQEEQVLVDLAARLADLIPALTPAEPRTSSIQTTPESRLATGITGGPGMGLGIGLLPSPDADFDAVPDRACTDTAIEENTFLSAVAAVRTDLRASGARLASVVPIEAHAMFRVYAELLGDEHLFADAIKRIRAGSWAPGALRQTIAEHAKVFEDMEDPYLRARAEDLRGLGRRVLLQLQSGSAEPPVYPEHCVLVGEEVSVVRIADVPIGCLAGIVCLRGSPFSHAAILARTLRIPAVMGVGAVPLSELGGRPLLVDGDRGHVIIDPGPLALEAFRGSVARERTRAAELARMRDLPSETRDGVELTFQVNVGLGSDIGQGLDCGAQGIGLYRSEFAFMVRDSFPSEDEQCQAYRPVLEAFAPMPVTMRTLDVGGDKGLPYFPIDEENPALGWRGIRLTLDNPGVFLTQLRAMLRANEGLGNLRLLLPMISSVREVDESCDLLARARDELAQEGYASPRPNVGVMIEVPAALYQLDALARRADFFSIGTNDLTQYMLAVDRNNARVAARYDSLHPAVLRALDAAARRASGLGIPISVCGDMAGDPGSAVLLLGMGLVTLSMASPSLPRVKQVLRAFRYGEARDLLKEALAMESAEEVHQLLTVALQRADFSEG